MNNKHLIIFVKNKIAGKVKTRLAAGIGPEKAMEVYEQLLDHTHKTTRCLAFDKIVYFSDEAEQDSLWADGNFQLKQQTGRELGERMSNAFNAQFAQGAEKVCIIGSDTFEISPAIIKEAFQALEKNDVVIGPANDGGYYLLGMQELQPELFHNKPWSTESVLAQTLEDIERLKLSYYLLPVLSDIDHKEDWLAYQHKRTAVK
jgi:uncharacterized protein